MSILEEGNVGIEGRYKKKKSKQENKRGFTFTHFLK